MMADENAQDEVSGLRALIEGADEVNFFTDVNADPAMATAFAELQEESNQRVRASAEEASAIRQRYVEAGKPFGLFLRTFEREAHLYNFAAEDNELLRVRGPQSVERKLHAALHPLVPLLAIRNPSDLIVDTLIPRLSAPDEDWEDVVERLAEDASLIVFDCFALAPGVATELELLRRCGRVDETVVVLSDPAAAGPFTLMLKGLELPSNERPSKDHPALMGFSRVVYESEID